MNQYETLLVEVKDGVGWITLNRPDAFNALDLKMTGELCAVARSFATDPAIRTVVLTGAGKAFCGGGNVKEMAKFIDDGSIVDFMQELTLRLHIFISEIVRMPKPVIAAVNGTAAGAGFSMSMACDLTLAAKSARFVMAYTNIALVPDGSSTYFLPRLVGCKKAMELILLNNVLSADDAAGLGIVNRVLPDESFAEEVEALAEKLAAGPTGAYGDVKFLLQRGISESLETQMENERQMIAKNAAGPDFREGVAAFVEKRAPRFGK